METQTIISFLAASMLLTISPGPDIIYVLMQSITFGKKYGIATALGLVLGIIIHTSLIAFGVSAIIQNSPKVFFSIKFLGAIYMLYLAYKVYKSSSKINLEENTVPKKTILELVKQGFIMNVLNPKVTIFFLAFFPVFIDVSKENTILQIYILGFLFMVQAFVIFSLLAIITDKSTVFLRTNKRFSSVLKWTQIIVFVVITVFIFIE